MALVAAIALGGLSYSPRAFAQSPAPATPAPRAPGAAAVQPVVERHVIGLSDPDFIVDFTWRDGVSPGDELELWRPVQLVHPVTHRAVMDRYRIGILRIVQVRDSICVARVVSTERPPASGDVVTRLPSPNPFGPGEGAPSAGSARAPATPVVAPAPAIAVPLPADSEATAVTTLFERLRGTSLVTRIREYEHYAATQPTGRYTRTLLEEAAALRELVSLREQAEADAPGVRHLEVAPETLGGLPLMITVELTGRAVGAVLHVRSATDGGYWSLPMYASGPKYFTATIPAEKVVAPRIEYFVDAVRATGESVPVGGSPEQPLLTRVTEVARLGAPLQHETTVSISTDYADYNRLRGNDHTFQTEGAFSLRFGDVGVRALRSGFGVYRGAGGSIHDLDDLGLRPRAVGMTYGYVEGEFGIKTNFAIVARAVVGLRSIGTAGGAAVLFRVGSDRDTDLLFGGEVLGGVGLRGIAELQIAPRARVPVLVRCEITNQPAGTGASRDGDPSLAPDVSVAAGTLGVRGIVQVGYRFVSPFLIAVRGSYEGRTISHSGPGVGGALEYRW